VAWPSSSGSATARATKDIDVVLQHPDADLARTLERALTGDDYQGFSFRRNGEPLVLDNGTVNMELAVSYRGGAWTSVTVDIARAMPLRFHIAQKLHGMTLPPRSGKLNDRFRDLIDLLLMEALVTNYAGLRAACEAVFRSRSTHEWPPNLDVPPYWIEPFARMAAELELPVADADEGMNRVRVFVTRILSA
jgi:hypothetical protein